jgi:hypothetical protein
MCVPFYAHLKLDIAGPNLNGCCFRSYCGHALSIVEMFPITLVILLSLNLFISTKGAASGTPGPLSERQSLSFSLDLHRECRLAEVRSPSVSHAQTDPLDLHIPFRTVKVRPTTVNRPRSQTGLQRARLRSLRYSESEKVEWETVETLGPDVEDRHTIAQLARMTGNAYALPGQENWYDIEPKWNNVCIISARTNAVLTK